MKRLTFLKSLAGILLAPFVAHKVIGELKGNPKTQNSSVTEFTEAFDEFKMCRDDKFRKLLEDDPNIANLVKDIIDGVDYSEAIIKNAKLP